MQSVQKYFFIAAFILITFCADTSLYSAGGGPDKFGYMWTDNVVPLEPDAPSFQWVSISGAPVGTPNWWNLVAQQGLTGDAVVDAPPPQEMAGQVFPFNFYGERVNTIRIGANGFISFNDDTGFDGFKRDNPAVMEIQKMPYDDYPAIIAPFLADLEPELAVPGGGVFLQYRDSDGDGVSDIMIIEYNNVPTINEVYVSFQVRLFAKIDAILIYYDSLSSDGQPHVIGIQNAGTKRVEYSPTSGLTYKYGMDFDINDRVVMFIFSSLPSPTNLYVNDSVKGTALGYSSGEKNGKCSPVVLQTYQPVFSAVFQGIQGTNAIWYRLQVSPDTTFPKEKVVWDTYAARMNPIPAGERTVDIIYRGLPLDAYRQYFWRILFWDDEPNNTGTFPVRTPFSSFNKPEADCFVIIPESSASGPSSGTYEETIGPYVGHGGGSAGGTCFVATATFENKINERQAIFTLLYYFRDNFLSNFEWGRKFINIYYNVGPILAEYVRDSSVLRFFTMCFLYPTVGFIKFSFFVSVPIKLLLLFTLVSLLVFQLWVKQHQYLKVN